MTSVYSLADYQLTITVPASMQSQLGLGTNSFSIGGPAETVSSGNGISGGFIGSITVSKTEDTWSTQGDYTGAYVHNKNLNRVGTITIAVNQMSADIVRLLKVCKLYRANDYTDGLNITVTNASSNKVVASGFDSRITKMPDQAFGESAATQDWIFTCGIIDVDY